MVGCKADLRTDTAAWEKLRAKGASLVSREAAQALCKELGGEMLLECSAKTQTGLKEVFDSAVRVALDTRKYIHGYMQRSIFNKKCIWCRQPSRESCECERKLLEVGSSTPPQRAVDRTTDALAILLLTSTHQHANLRTAQDLVPGSHGLSQDGSAVVQNFLCP